MIPVSSSIILLSVLTVLVYLGLGHRVLDRMRLTSKAALIILLTMILGHFLPTIRLTQYTSLNLGAAVPLAVVIYLLGTTSTNEQVRALIVSGLTALLIVLSDRLLPPDPGLLDPVFSGGIFAGLLAYIWGRSRRSAFIAGILGVFLADLAAVALLRTENIPQRVILGSGGLFSSAVISPFLAVFIAEVIGEIRERWQHGAKLQQGGGEDD